MEWQMEPQEEGNLALRLSGNLTVENAEQLQTVLRQALARCPRVRIEPSGELAADLCGLQLLCAAHRTARAGGGSLVLAPGATALQTAAQRAGLRQRPDCGAIPGNQCLWQGDR